MVRYRYDALSTTLLLLLLLLQILLLATKGRVCPIPSRLPCPISPTPLPLLPLLPPMLLPLLFLNVHDTGAANRRSEGTSS